MKVVDAEQNMCYAELKVRSVMNGGSSDAEQTMCHAE
jgi:hypothetical protein